MKNLQIILFTFLITSFSLSAQMIVDQQGQIGIGTKYETTTSVSSSWALDVDGKVQINPGISVPGFSFSKVSNKPLFTMGYNIQGYLGSYYNRFRDVWTYNVQYTVMNQYSDIRLKENIRPIKSALQRILKVNTVQYDLKAEYFKGSDPEELKENIESGKNHYGVIAQELKEIFPNLVQYNEDSQYNSVNYVSLIPIMIKAMQEQQAIIEELKGEIKILKDRK